MHVFQATRHLFVAAEKRIPRIRIETRQAEILKGQKIIVSIDSWPRSSKYPVVSSLVLNFICRIKLAKSYLGRNSTGSNHSRPLRFLKPEFMNIASTN
jgi:hypothetical protein